MKYITITAPGRMKDSIIFLLRPGVTTEDILKALKLTGFVLLHLFPLSGRPRLFCPKDKLYERISNGDCLVALALSEAEEFYWLSYLTTVQELADIFTRYVREGMFGRAEVF